MDFEVEYDVAVIGGGTAGAAAALQAARSGKRTVLIEKTVLLGGLATSGLVYIYLPLCDGYGRQVSFGITEELLHNSYKYGPGEIPPGWNAPDKVPDNQNRYKVRFSPASFMLSLEELLLESGVELWLDTLVCDVECHDSKLTSVIVENESGRGRICAKCFIDASGSCVAARRAGLDCLEEDNFLTIWALMHHPGAQTCAGSDMSWFQFTAANLNKPNDLTIAPELKTRMFSGMSDDEIRQAVTWRGISGKKVSSFVMRSHDVLREHCRQLQEKEGSLNEHFPVKLPLMPQFRKICCLDGEYVLKAGENNRHFDDSIGLAADWRKCGPVWEIPYRTMYTKKLGGLLAAGRCTAASGDAWEITRVIPAAALTGQAAGLAAAMSIDQNKEVWELDITELQDKLRALDVRIHLEDVGLGVR